MDKDLQSIQDSRDLVKRAHKAQESFHGKTQEEVDKLVARIAKNAEAHAVELAELAVKDTGYGNVKDKITKNVLASRVLYDSIKDMKTIGVVHEDRESGTVEIAVPFGVIAGLVPSTNPTSTVIYKSMIALKAGNAIVFSPHPAAQKCIGRAVEVVREAISNEGFPADLVTVLPNPTLEGTDALMSNDDLDLILATGGSAMVKAAYSSGTPALGVGPGNVPVFIEKSADIQDAVAKIIVGKSFDNGLICASEQSVIAEKSIADQVLEEFKRQKGYVCTPEEKKKFEAIIDNARGGINTEIVGQTAVEIAEMAGVKVPADTKVILAEEDKVGPGHPFSREKLSPLLGFYVEDDPHAACNKAIELLKYGGLGHTMGIHSNNQDIIMEFALEKPVSRFLVNTPTTLGAVGATTALAPAFTLGCGAVGGSATSDNVTPMNLINLRRLAYGINEVYELTPQEGDKNSKTETNSNNTDEMIEKILKVVMQEIADR